MECVIASIRAQGATKQALQDEERRKARGGERGAMYGETMSQQRREAVEK